MFGKLRKGRICVSVCCLAGIAVLAAGCGMGGRNEVMKTTGASPISYSWWGNDERHAYTMEGVDLFQKMNPDIDVDYRYGVWQGYEKRTKVYMESHTEADVMQINYAWLDTYSRDGNGYYDLYQLRDIIGLDNFSEEDLKFGEVNGKLNAIPIAFNTLTIYYNKDIYDRYNLSLPVTWEDYFTAAEAMREDGIYPIGMPKKQMVLFLVAYFEQTTGQRVFGEDGEFLLNEEDISYILLFYKRLIEEKALMPLDQFDRAKFVGGKIAGAMFWVSDAGSYCEGLEAAGGTPMIGEYPMAPDAKLSGWYMKPATMYAISSITDYPKESARLLDYLLNSSEMAGLQKTEKGVPVSKTALEELRKNGYLDSYEYEASQKMIAERDKMNIMIPVMENETILDIFKKDSDSYLYDKMELMECAGTICDDIKAALSQNEEMQNDAG